MTQQINLFLPEFQPKKDLLDSGNMMLFASITVAILLLVTIKEYWDSASMNQELATRQLERARIIAETDQLINDFGTQSEDLALSLRVQSLEEELSNKQILMSFMDGRNIGSTEGFSEYLADLARYHLGGLRLTSVLLSKGGAQIELKGEVLSAHLVPQYLQSLRQGQSFSGKEFDSLQIIDVESEESESALKNFSVATAN